MRTRIVVCPLPLVGAAKRIALPPLYLYPREQP